MTIFHVLKYSPLKADYSTARRIPVPVLREWFLQAFDSDMVMTDPEEMKNTKFRDETYVDMSRGRHREWFINSVVQKGKQSEAVALLRNILFDYENTDEHLR